MFLPVQFSQESFISSKFTATVDKNIYFRIVNAAMFGPHVINRARLVKR